MESLLRSLDAFRHSAMNKWCEVEGKERKIRIPIYGWWFNMKPKVLVRICCASDSSNIKYLHVNAMRRSRNQNSDIWFGSQLLREERHIRRYGFPSRSKCFKISDFWSSTEAFEEVLILNDFFQIEMIFNLWDDFCYYVVARKIPSPKPCKFIDHLWMLKLFLNEAFI